MADVTVAAVVLRDLDGRVLTVRKRGTHRFMLPGGKLEPGETAAEAAVREIQEELALSLPPEALTGLGDWLGPAANEPGHVVLAHLFEAGGTFTDLEPCAELDAVAWLDVDAPLTDDLAPLLTQHVVELLRRRVVDNDSSSRHPR